MSASDKHPVPPFPPRPVQRFVQRHFRSAIEIELLLLLFRSPHTFWSPSAVANVIGTDEGEIEAHLGRFASAGLLVRGKHTDAFRFAPARIADRDTVAELAKLYAAYGEELLRAITGSSAPPAAFSDALPQP